MQTLRPAGLNERRCIARDTLGLYGSIVTLGLYSKRGTEELSKHDIFKALKHCVVQHPVLATVIQDSESESPQLARLPTIDLADHVRQLEAVKPGDGLVQHLLEQIHNEPLHDYEKRPQWRVYILPISPPNPRTETLRFHLAFASSHALVDGSSGLSFHTSFLEALNRLQDLSYDEEPLLEPSLREVPLPCEQAGDLTISWSFLLRPLLSEFLPPWLSRYLGLSSEASFVETPTWTGSTKRPERLLRHDESSTETPDASSAPDAGPSTSETSGLSESYKLITTACEVTLLPHSTLHAVLAACKSHNARLTGLLNHLTARALARALHARDQQYVRFAADTAIDLRRCVPESANKMGNYVSSSSESIHAPGTTVANVPVDWYAVQTTTQALLQASGTLADQPVGLLRYLSKIRDWVIKKASTPAEGSFGMSNVGAFDGQRGGTSPWSIEEMVFSQSADATGLPFNINVCSAKGGSLAIVLTWWPGMLGVQDERQFVKEINSELIRQLHEIGRQE